MRFSIITITYNAAATLEPTILSVIGQTCTDIEYIIVDGASKDGTLGIVGKYADKGISLISEPDKGIYDAMNKGLKLATGDYVWFMNAGDRIYAPDTVQQIKERLHGDMPDIIYGETAIINDAGDFVGMRRLKAPRRLSRSSFKAGMTVCHQSFIARRGIAPYYDTAYRFSADFDWCIRCMAAARTIFNTDLILSKYLNEGTTTRNLKASLKERYRIMSKHYGVISTTLRHIVFVFRFAFAKISGDKRP